MICDLIRFYDKFLPEEDKIPFGYKKETISYAIDLRADGSIESIVELPCGEKERGQELICPSDGKPESSGPVPRFMWGKIKYFVRNWVDIKDPKKPEKSKKVGDSFFQASKKLHEELLQDCNAESATAVKRFFEKMATADRNFKEEDYLAYRGKNFVFRFKGKYLIHDDDLRYAWEHRAMEGEEGYSCFSGKKELIRKQVQPQFNIIGTAAGSPLIARKEDVDSFQLRYPMPDISYEDTFKYSEALYYMLSKRGGENNLRKYCTILGDMTVLHWAETKEEIDFSLFFAGESDSFDDDNETLNGMFKHIGLGQDFNKIEIPCHIVGLIGRSGRIQQAFNFSDSLNSMVEAAYEHMERLRIKGLGKRPSFYGILQMVADKGDKLDKYHTLIKDLFAAVLGKARYPMYLYSAILEKAKTEIIVGDIKDDSFRFIQYLSILKAVLIKNFGKGEGLVELNQLESNTAYLLGRVFAVALATVDANRRDNMEKVKERWFRAAMETPSVAYGQFLQSAELYNANEFKITEIMDKIRTPLPQRLSLEEQGMWMLGYYHQLADMRAKRQK